MRRAIGVFYPVFRGNLHTRKGKAKCKSKRGNFIHGISFPLISMQFFQNPQVFFREEGRVGLSQVEGGRLHEGADVGGREYASVRQIKDRAEAAGQVFV